MAKVARGQRKKYAKKPKNDTQNVSYILTILIAGGSKGGFGKS